MNATAVRDADSETASAMLRRGEYREAVAFLTSRKSLSPMGMDYLCDAYFQLRDWTSALAVLRVRVKRGPIAPFHRRLEAKILSNMGRHKEALASIRAFLKTNGGDAEALGVAKICCHFLGDDAGARLHGQKALLAKDRAAGPPPPDLPPWKPRVASGRVIAFSVFGDRKIYLLGAAINIQLAKRHFPGWTVRLYCASSLGPAWLDLYRGLGAEVVLADRDFPDVPEYVWRFLVADDPDVGTYMCRDADSRIGAEEAQLVAAWQASGLPFHVIRDHVLHDDPMLAGLWGGTGWDALRMRELVIAWFRGRTSAKYTQDQQFLAAAVWPRVRSLAFVHDPFYSTPGVMSHRHAFPGLRLGLGHQGEAKVIAEAQALGIAAP
ncbi:MAG TPA: hypothetical protein VHA82_00490 [Ramlibacter sp.]|uniref:hypothetical protein n=1 Tax=Ramlibacter sp. TaxID=1917967 RepID=UPI002BEE87BA|nr:hypothetical protein [Ramlibacter sp.]HVZ42257.1 hypothetical protein [Ramlibacter sp.]